MPDFENPYEGAIDHLPEDEEVAGECAFCDNGVPGFQEGPTFVAHFQILVAGGNCFLVCGSCWDRAYEGADLENVSASPKVRTIFSHA